MSRRIVNRQHNSLPTRENDIMSAPFRIVAAATVLIAALSTNARADEVGDIVSSLEKAKDASEICSKPSMFKAMLRSFEGRACNTPYIAGFAQIVCGHVGDFDQSKCAKAAILALGGKSGAETLQAAAINKQGRAKDFVCVGARKTSNAVLSKIAAAARCVP
jgi:hypothetical protein